MAPFGCDCVYGRTDRENMQPFPLCVPRKGANYNAFITSTKKKICEIQDTTGIREQEVKPKHL